MAAPMMKTLRSLRNLYCRHLRDVRRTYLSDSYSCDEAWKKRLDKSYIEKLDAKLFGIELWTKSDTTHLVKRLDMNLFATKLHTLSNEDEYIAKEIIYRFRHSQSSFPIQDSIGHAIVRSYIKAGWAKELLQIIKDKDRYGIFPDFQAMCMLLDYLLTENKYAEAASLAYEVMLQEDFSHTLTNLLSLIAVVKHFTRTCTFQRYERPAINPDEEPQYVAVTIITNPHYDDHFDIKDERLLLGKTMYYLGKETQGLPKTLSRTLQLIGLGLYEKFELANQILESWLQEDSADGVIHEFALQKYSEYLEEAPTRDPNKPPVKMGEKTLDDEIELLRLTPDEKASCIEKLNALKSQLVSNKKLIGEFNLENAVEEFIWQQDLPKLEQEDSKVLESNYQRWAEEVDNRLKMYVVEEKTRKVEEEIQKKLEALQEREELLTYFDHLKEIRFYQKSKEKEVKKKEVEEDYVAAPGERNVKKK
ncbi:28S ribosomal protein S27, mitochondrial-like [Dreissena polymorpha]|uniref:28S ribosomal protein S27, mitochondrial n=1 Tax=Dreissena polymorpha TaxID=45954 RepID=A0A9D3Y8E2_DREPO|nr:28S ribosomal protein S27, mitochondrial-like [Dreissena polymorpha]KAH3695142.1 hypothetical protein DPMN_082598 [Dreissena polymorpha]